MMNKIDQNYLSKLKEVYSKLKLETIEANELRDIKEVELKDIFIPLKLIPSEKNSIELEELEFYQERPEKVKDVNPDELISEINQIIAYFEIQEPVKEESEDLSEFFLSPEPQKTPVRKLILAKPGFGKSTLAKRITLACIDNDVNIKNCYGLKGRLFPVLLYCRSLSDKKFKNLDDFILAAYQITMRELPGIGLDFNSFEKLLTYHARNSSLLLIIDGFDELLEQSGREQILRSLIDFLKEYPKTNLIITSRPNIFSDTHNKEVEQLNNIKDLKRWEIPSLTQGEIEEFISKWFRAVYPDKEKAVRDAYSLIEQFNSPARHKIRQIIKSPLDLKKLLVLSINKNRIPESSAGLYYSFIKLYLNWKKQDKFNSEDTINILSFIAYHMSKNGMKRISSEELIKVLNDCAFLFDGSFSVPVNVDYIIDFILELKNRSCLLESISEDVYEFTHLQYQEFLTAYGIAHQFFEDIDKLSVVDIIKEHYKDNSWQEIIKLVIPQIRSKRVKESIIDFYLSELEKNEDNTYASNLLFDLLINESILKESQRDRAYELILKDRLSEPHLRKMEELVESKSEDKLLEILDKKYKESFREGEPYYTLALGALRALRNIREGKDPLKEAEEIILSGNEEDVIIGINILSEVAWCIYSFITLPLVHYRIKLKPETIKILKELLLSHKRNILDLKLIADLKVVNFIDNSLYDEELFLEMVELLKSEDKNLISLGVSVLSSFPIGFESFSFHLNYDVKDLAKIYYQFYQGDLKKENVNELMTDFLICYILGCFKDFDEVRKELSHLEGFLNLHLGETDDLTISKLNQAKLELWDKKNLGKSALEYYLKGDIQSAKELYILSYIHGYQDAANNLAYMLRRGEIDEVVVNGKSYTIEELLEDGLRNNDGFSIINYTLYKSFINGDYDIEKGLKILKEFNLIPGDIRPIYNWWNRLNKEGDNEGAIVLLWLNALGCL